MKRKKKAAAAKGSYALPAHWPRYTTAEYYAWQMDRMPPGAVAADWSKHKPHNSYSPLYWYVDQRCTCKDCGAAFNFTKEDQRHLFEELKAPIQTQAVRCSDCRRKIRGEKKAQKQHMEEMAKREPHPHTAFFKRRKPA